MSDTDHGAVGSAIARGFMDAALPMRILLRGAGLRPTLLQAALLWLFAPSVLQAAADDNTVSLRVQPRLCVMAVADEVCVMQLQVSWTTLVERNVCLHLPDHPQPMPCWQAQQAGEFSLTVARSENLSVQLLDEQTLEVLSAVEIPVIQRDLRDTRRRRRHAWSIL